MNTQKAANKRGPLTLMLGIGIPAFMLAIMLAAGVLLMNGGVPSANALSLANASQGPDRASLGNGLHGTNQDSSGGKNSLHTRVTNSGGGCWSYYTSSPDATYVTSSNPTVYGFDGSDAPSLSLAFNRCSDYIQVAYSSGHDYYKIDWWRPGRSGWTQYTTSNSSSNFTNAHYGTTYEFTVEACTSHWYGDSCTAWSPRVYVTAN